MKRYLRDISIKLAFVYIVFIAILFMGCSQNSTEIPAVYDDSKHFPITETSELPTVALSEAGSLPASRTMFATDEGIFYFSEGTRLLMYEDWVHSESYPLCVVPNCTHSSSSCSAWFSSISGGPQYLHYDGTYLYYYMSDTQGFYRQNIDGTDKERVVDVSDYLGISASVVYGDNVAYFVVEKATETDGEYTQTLLIAAGDLSSGKLTVYSYAFEDQLSIYGLYGNSLILANQIYDTDALRLGNTPSTNTITFLLDLETEEIIVLMDGTNTFNSSAGLGGIHQGVFAITVFSGEGQTINTAEASVFDGTLYIFDLINNQGYFYEIGKTTWDTSVRDGKIFYPVWDEEIKSFTFCIYDLNTGEIKEFPDSMDSYYFYETNCETDDWFLLAQYDEEGNLMTSRIHKEDFYNNNLSVIPIMCVR